MKRFLAFLVPLALVACQDLPEPTGLPVDASQALQAPSSNAIPGQYIVVFRDNVADVPGLARGLV
ncbi:MAG: hypothetical protein M3418_05975, partial [Gemmatimonadota bacterium]|nr:hypothetical protein [Gemmatimonadota bacterium]